MLKICIIESYESPYIDKCLESLRLNTQISFNVKVFQENKSREHTLNNILAEMSGMDLVVAADDILFTKGWDRALLTHWKKDRILGFSMLYPGGEVIQDRGYRLISIDGIVSSEAIDRGLKRSLVTPFEYESRGSMTGCFQAIPSFVSKMLNQFPLEGCNRLGELLYHSMAIRKGIEVGVVGHFLEHHGKSTKRNPDKKLSSESYLFEKKLWSQLTKDFRLSELTSIEVTRQIEKNLNDWFRKPGLIYGAGTITEFLGVKNNLESHLLCSGLQEEDGMALLGKNITYKDNVDWTKVKRVLIAVEGQEKVISKDLKKLTSEADIHYVKIYKINQTHHYGIQPIHGH
jgi:hypothetical protein